MRDLLNSAYDCYDEGRFAEAVALSNKALAQSPDHFGALNLQASALLEIGDRDGALAALRHAVATSPDQPLGRFNLAQMLVDNGAHAEALSHASAGLDVRRDAAGLVIQAAALSGLNRHEGSLASLDEARRIEPDLAGLQQRRAVALWNLGRLREALAAYDDEIRSGAHTADLFTGRARVLREIGELDAALASHLEAQRLAPDTAAIAHDVALLLNEMVRKDECLRQIERTLALDPRYTGALVLRATIRIADARWSDALADLRRVAEIEPVARAYQNVGDLLLNLNFIDEALAFFERAERLDRGYDLLAGSMLFAQLASSDWTGFDQRLADFRAGLASDTSTSPPFNALFFLDDAAGQKAIAERYARTRFNTRAARLARTDTPNRRIRIGFFSPDFGDHPVADLMKGVLVNIDRDRFETIGFSIKRRAVDEQKPIADLFDQFHDVDGVADAEIVSRARTLGVDIAIDLAGYTRYARPSIFALRAAPVQVNYLGYSGTMGLDFYDYIIGDDVIIPAAHEADYAERVVRLPASYMPALLQGEEVTGLSRGEQGLPQDRVVLCGFNNYAKIGPALFGKWMDVLKGAPESVLWLSSCNEVRRARLREAARRLGVSPDRIVFATREPDKAQHLARVGLADLFLDTAPYNAHITCAEALGAGVPVLTQIGNAYAGRVAASLLTAAGLSDMIVCGEAAFVARGVELASNREALAEVRGRLARNRDSAPFFDVSGFTRGFEQALLGMLAAPHP